MLKTLARIGSAFKAFTMRFSASASWGSFILGGTRRDWRSAAGDGRGNAIVMACVRWVGKTLPEAPMLAYERNRDGKLEPKHEHPLTMLLETPNPFYSGMHLMGATASDLMLSGNAYWIKVRSGARRVVELWWVPSTMIEPQWPDDGSVFISHYQYTVEGNDFEIPTSEVVHFREIDFDPSNMRKGQSPLASLFRELATDNEAANMTASLLGNAAIPGVVVSPEGEGVATQEEADEIKDKWVQRFGGDNRGAPLVMKGATRVSVLSFSPEQMQLRELRRIPEERVTAIFGTPAVVVGLGAGLDRSTYNNMAEAREAAYESNIIPLQKLMGAAIQTQLVPDFGDPSKLKVRPDYSEVRVLQADQNALHERVRADWLAGLITMNQALQETGRDVLTGPEGDVRAIPGTVTLTEPAGLLAPAPLPAAEQDAAGDQPSNLRALTEAASRRRASVATKGIDDIPRLFDLLREDDEPQWQEAIEGYLKDQLARVITRLSVGDETAEILLPVLEAGLLGDILESLQRRTLASVRRIAVAELGVVFNLPDPAVREYLEQAGQNIQGITDTTRDAIRAALIAGQAEGEGIPQLVQRLRGLTAFSRSRAETVARTELGLSQQAATLTAYKASGVVVGVRVLDGDYDEECQAMNGRTFPLDKAPSLLEHPRCRRAFSPLLDLADLESPEGTSSDAA